jgi:predicted ester cyclase
MRQRFSHAVLLACLLIYCGGCETAETRKYVVRGYLDELLVAQRWQKWDEFMGKSPSYNGTGLGRDAFQAVAHFLNTTFSEVSVTIEDQRVDGSWVITRLSVRGMQTGEFLNVKPRNRPVRFRAILMDRLESGHVVEMWHQFDYYDALLQVARP